MKPLKPFRQLLFESVIGHLKRQEWRRSIASGSDDYNPCAYRGLDNTKCAVGHLIPNRNYNITLEGNDVCSITNKLPSYANKYMMLLSNLQSFHDHRMSTAAMRATELRHIAEACGLTVQDWMLD